MLARATCARSCPEEDGLDTASLLERNCPPSIEMLFRKPANNFHPPERFGKAGRVVQLFTLTSIGSSCAPRNQVAMLLRRAPSDLFQPLTRMVRCVARMSWPPRPFNHKQIVYKPRNSRLKDTSHSNLPSA